MKKIFIVLALLCVFSLHAAPAANQNTQPAKTTVAKSYTFAEELVDLPIKPFVPGQLSNADLMNTSPEILKLYETAVNAEKQANAFSNPGQIIKAWTELTKITQKNPFLYTANARLNEWKTCIELLNKHQENLDKIKMLLLSTLLSEEQKTNIIIQHLDEFGLSFGTQEVVDLIGKTSIPNNAVFQAKVKETKQKRCEKNSGKDCFECAKATTTEPEQFALFEKSCGLRFQPGCEEVNKIKAAKEAEKAKLAAEEKRKADEFAKRTFTFQDEPVNVINPFVLGQVNEQDILSADQKVLKMFEATVNKEKQPEIIKTPGAMIVAWEEITKITEKNPFMQTATQRLAEWKAALEKLEKHEAKLAEMKKVEADNALPANYRTAFAVNYLNEFGVNFGTTEVVKATVYNNEIAYNESLTTKIKEIRKQRCDLNSAVDCQTYGLKHSANDDEKAAYLKKACDLGRKAACSGEQPQNTAAPAPVETQAKVAEQPKKEPTEEDKYKAELNQAGRKKRIAIATSTLVAGVVVGALGGVSFYGMNNAKKDRDKYLDSYRQSTTQESMNYFRKKTNDADKKRKTYMALGGVGIGVGVALIATGITFYCIEFEGEKGVKKKYNVSIGASPMDGTLQFALRW
jgi:hypothetical protein